MCEVHSGAMNYLLSALDLHGMTLLASLLFIVSRHSVHTTIYVVDASNNTLASLADYPTDFGPSVPSDGLWGHHVFVVPPDGCTPVLPPPSNDTWFAVILHSHKCPDINRVYNSQQAGFKAAIIYSNQSDSVTNNGSTRKAITNYSLLLETVIKIPSTVVEGSSGSILLKYEKQLNTTTVLKEFDMKRIWLFFAIGIAALFTVIIFSSCLACIIHRCCGHRKKSIGLLSRWKLKKLAVHTFRTGDVFDVCAICLEDYQAGEKLRLLPCSHAFHCKCVDVWLTENKKTCPLCNIAADSKQQLSHHINEDTSERTPLLSGSQPDEDQVISAEDRTGSAPLHGAEYGVAIRVPSVGSNIIQSAVEVYEQPPSPHGQVRNYGSFGSSVTDLSAPVVTSDDEGVLNIVINSSSHCSEEENVDSTDTANSESRNYAGLTST